MLQTTEETELKMPSDFRWHSFLVSAGYLPDTISNTVKRKLLRISELDEKSQTYTMSAYLIVQIGKNFVDGRNNRITGAEMLELVGRLLKKCSIWVRNGGIP